MFSDLESQIRVVLDDLSNGQEAIQFSPEEIEVAVDQFRAALVKQTTPRDKDFKLRMSNIGRVTCQLQQEQMGSPRERMPYNHWMRMVIGDCVEILVRMVLDKSHATVSSDGDEVEISIKDTVVKGTSDIDIEGKVYDIKSASQYMFRNKWKGGFQALYKADDFGYVGQLYGYADAQDKEVGGWIVVDKSSGEILVVEVDASSQQEAFIRQNREHVVGTISNNLPFQRCFEPEDETYYRKKTGGKILNKTCSWCPFKTTCWPEARYLPSPTSTANPPPRKWYIEYPNDDQNTISES